MKLIFYNDGLSLSSLYSVLVIYFYYIFLNVSSTEAELLIAVPYSRQNPKLNFGEQRLRLRTNEVTASSLQIATRVPAPDHMLIESAHQIRIPSQQMKMQDLLEILIKMPEAMEHQSSTKAPPVVQLDQGHSSPQAQLQVQIQSESSLDLISKQQELVRLKQLEQQKFLNIQYELQNRKELQLKKLQMEVLEQMILIQRLKRKQQLEMETKKLHGHKSVSAPPVESLHYEVAPQSGHISHEQVKLPEVYEIVEPPIVTHHSVTTTHSEITEPEPPIVLCDERQQVGRTKIVEVRTAAGKYCKVKIETFDKCPETEPVSFEVESVDPHHPDDCKGVENFIRATKFVTNTASRLPGQILGATQYAVDVFDTVKDFYSNLIHNKKQADSINSDNIKSSHIHSESEQIF